MIIKNIFVLYRKIFSWELFYFDVVYIKGVGESEK